MVDRNSNSAEGNALFSSNAGNSLYEQPSSTDNTSVEGLTTFSTICGDEPQHELKEHERLVFRGNTMYVVEFKSKVERSDLYGDIDDEAE